MLGWTWAILEAKFLETFEDVPFLLGKGMSLVSQRQVAEFYLEQLAIYELGSRNLTAQNDLY